MTPAEDLVGEVLDSYLLLEIIGSGGMGQVYRAQHTRLGREVALKLLRPEYALSRESVARFFQEAQAVQRIRHRNIVDVTDLDRLDDGTPFIIMELVEGMSLRRWIVTHRSETERVLQLFTQICDGLTAAHEVGIIHRDLKPDNVMVTIDHDGTDLAKLLDFGIAKLINREGEEYDGWKTTEGFVMGTPAYMAPEQAGGLPIDARTDIYALGAIMYEMFTGQPVFTGKSAGEYVRKHLNEDPILPRRTEGGAHLDPRIESIIMRCLAKEPSDRYASAVALRRDIERILAGEEIAEVSTTRPLRTTGRAPAMTGRERRPSHKIAGDPGPDPVATPAANETGMVVGDLPAPSATGRRILWSILPLAVAASAAVAWYTIRARSAADRAGASPGVEWSETAAAGEAGDGAERPTALTGVESRAPAATTRSPDGSPLAVVPVVTERKTISVRFESRPSAEVFKWGFRQAHCTTPCDVSLTDEGAPTQRVMLSREGYHPEIVVIDMAEPRANVRVSLRKKRRDSGDDGRERDRQALERPDGVDSEPVSGDSPETRADASGAHPPPAGDAVPDPSGRPTPPRGREEQTSPAAPPKKPARVSPSDTLNPFD